MTAPQAVLNARPAEVDVRNYPPTQPTPDRQPPTGPSSARTTQRSGSIQVDHSFSAHSTGPPTPVADSVPHDLVGMHPDRLRGFQEGEEALDAWAECAASGRKRFLMIHV